MEVCFTCRGSWTQSLTFQGWGEGNLEEPCLKPSGAAGAKTVLNMVEYWPDSGYDIFLQPQSYCAQSHSVNLEDFSLIIKTKKRDNEMCG